MTRLADRFHARTVLSATRLNRVVDVANDTARGVVSGSVSTAGFTALTLRSFEIKALSFSAGNPTLSTLTCVELGQSGNGSAIEADVYLPQIFTEPSRGGVSYAYTDINNRDATGGVAETQQLTPEFIVGEEVAARWCVARSAWVFVGDGRMWAKVP